MLMTVSGQKRDVRDPGEGVPLGVLGRGVPLGSRNPDPISDQDTPFFTQFSDLVWPVTNVPTGFVVEQLAWH